MSTNRKMLKEAIAEAKAVKEMAIANAKASLEEAFTPQIQSMLSAKLHEMEQEDEEEMEINETEEIDENETIEEAEDEDMDLDELLKELEENEEYEDSDADGIPDDVDAEPGDDEPSSIEDMTDEDLKSFIEDVLSDMVENGELDLNAEHEEEETEEDEELEDETEEEEINIDELLAEVELEEDETLEEYAELQPSDVPGSLNDDEMDNLKSELKLALETIKTLRGDLNEVNLLNAKLLYTNKIFKAKNLNEGQKLNVLNNFDKAVTVKEVKLVYETLKDNFKVKPTRITENLGSASKGVGTTKTKQPIIESNEMVKRFQTLAGIN